MVEGCSCNSIGAPASTVRFCDIDGHHKYWKGDRELVSVTKVLRSVWPIKPDFHDALPGVIENARHRGSIVDYLFSEYITDRLTEIPAGVRQDAVELFLKAKAWWDGRHIFAESQVILADENIAGMCDVLADDEFIYDLKCTYDVEPMYPIQLAAYADLYFATRKRPVKKLAIIHVTKRLRKPEIIPVDMATTLPDWMLVKDTWLMAQRRCSKEGRKVAELV